MDLQSSDEHRIRALSAPFKQRSVNPEHYDNKMNYWCDNIVKWCNKENVMKFNVNDFKTTFSCGDIIPLVFEEVSKELVRRRQIIPEKNLKIVYQKESWAGWGMDTFLTSPIKWAISNVFSLSGFGHSSDDYFVNFSVMENKSKLVLKLLDHKKCVLSDSEIYHELHDAFMSKEDLSLVLKYLSMKNLVQVKELSDGVTIFKSIKNKKDFIKKEDITSWKLNLISSDLQNEIENIETNIHEANETIRLSLSSGMRLKAKRELLRRKKLEKHLKHKYSVFDNIENLINSINEAKTNQSICEAFQESAASLEDILKKPESSVESVEKVVDKLQDLIEHKEDIEEIIAFSDKSVDMSELEMELDELLLSDSPSKINDTAVPESVSVSPKIDPTSKKELIKSPKKTLVYA